MGPFFNFILRSKSGASKSRPRWAAHTRLGNVWECPPLPPGKYHYDLFDIVSNFSCLRAREITYNNFEILLEVFMPNIMTNHAITYTSLENEQLFTKNTKIGAIRTIIWKTGFRIVLFSLIHNEMTEARQESHSTANYELINCSLAISEILKPSHSKRD